MLNSDQSKQRKQLRRLSALQMKALRLVQKDSRLGGEFGGLEPDEVHTLEVILQEIDGIVGKGKSWLRILSIRPKEKKV